MPFALIVEPDSSDRRLLARLAEDAGFRTQEVSSLAAAREALRTAEPELALVGVALPDGSGSDLLGALEALPSSPEIILIAPGAAVASSAIGLPRGVHDCFAKPIDTDRSRIVLAKVAEVCSLKQELMSLRDELRVLGRFGSLIGASSLMQDVYGLVAKVAPTSTAVFLTGESGTGKDLVAATIHELGRRRKGPFLAFDCGAFAPGLVESELFGRDPGKTSGSMDAHKGCFERAGGGTLFLDEIAEMPIGLQAGFLRALETSAIVRIGGDRPIRVDARVIAASSREASEALRDGNLREDLVRWLEAFTIRLPPLRDRGDDVVLLASHFTRQLSKQCGTEKTLAADALEYLKGLAWPGNVRELKNVLGRAFAIADGNVIGCAVLERVVRPRRKGSPVSLDDDSPDVIRLERDMTLARAEKKLILWALRTHGGDKKRAAASLGISVRTLYNRLKEYGREAPIDS